MTDAPTVFRVPDVVQDKFRAEFKERLGAQPDTDSACAFFVQLFLGCSSILDTDDIPLAPSVVAESDRLAVLTVGRVPLLSLMTCTKMQQARANNAIRDIRCSFVHPTTQLPLASGVVKIEFWRHDVPDSERQPAPYTPLAIQMDLAATPIWDADQLRIDGPLYATDRANLLLLMRLVRNMHELMPVGIQTAIDLVYSSDFQSEIRSKRKRGDYDERSIRKQRKGHGATDDIVSSHIGYCVVFQHPIAMPTINQAFMKYVVDKVGPTVMNWLVLFASTKPLGDDSVKRRNEALAVIIRHSETPDDHAVPFTISGTKWLARRLDAAV